MLLGGGNDGLGLGLHRSDLMRLGIGQELTHGRGAAAGSGLVCSHLLDEKLAHYCWLANATGSPGNQRFEATRKWVLKQHLTTRKADCFGIEVDLNSGSGLSEDFGQWKPKR